MADSLVEVSAGTDAPAAVYRAKRELESAGYSQTSYVSSSSFIVKGGSAPAIRSALANVLPANAAMYKVTQMESPTVAMATSARCPYCAKSVSMSSSTLGDHRVPGGACDGSGRRVANLTDLGFAIFAQDGFEEYKARIMRIAGLSSLSDAQLRRVQTGWSNRETPDEVANGSSERKGVREF